MTTPHSTAVPPARLKVEPQSAPTAARRAAHSVSVTAGRLTSRARMLPGFLIVGAQRGGTTSMYRTLDQHPAILKAVLHKGVHYFDTGYGHGLGWYQGHFPLRARAALARRATGDDPLTFESSPYYMFHPLAAGRISRDLPGVRLLVLVRDPVERAYSAHAHELARGYETEPFERALDLEDQRLAGEADRIISEPGYLSHSHQHHAYLTRGLYADQLERLAQAVGRDRVHVVDSGRFFTDPEPVYDGVLEFLGLRRHGYPAFERHNARPRSPMPETLRATLNDHFKAPDERLASWLGHPPSWR
jgi:Sulfotransferase domain